MRRILYLLIPLFLLQPSVNKKVEVETVSNHVIGFESKFTRFEKNPGAWYRMNVLIDVTSDNIHSITNALRPIKLYDGFEVFTELTTTASLLQNGVYRVAYDWSLIGTADSQNFANQSSALNSFPNRTSLANTLFVQLVIGQSNHAEGRAEVSRLALTTYSERPSGVTVFQKTDTSAAANGDFEAVMSGINTKEPDQSGSVRVFGAPQILAQKLFEITGNRPFIIGCGDGGTSLQINLNNPDWDPSSSAENFEIALTRYFDVAFATILGNNPTKTVKVIIEWAHGESDALDATATSNYAANFAAFYTAVRAHGTYASYLTDAMWIIPTINYLQSANETTINNAFIAHAAGAGSGKVYVVDMSGQLRKVDLSTPQKGGFTPTTGSDDEHLSYLAQIYLGEQSYSLVRTHYGISTTHPVEKTTNTEFNVASLSSSGVWLPFSRNEVTIGSDNSISAANNTLTGSDFTAVSTTDTPRFKVDKSRGAVEVTGLTTVARFETASPVGTSLFSDSFSVAFYCKPRSPISGTVQTVIHDTQDAPQTNDSRLLVGIVDGKVYGYIALDPAGAPASAAVQFKTANVITSGSTDWAGAGGEDVHDWVHIAVTFTNGDFVRVYVNGVLVANDSSPTFLGDISSLPLGDYVNNTNKLLIGANRSGASTYNSGYFGMLRELVILPGVILNTTDIANLMLN